MTPETLKSRITHQLSARYGLAEAASIARIVLEDVFQVHRMPVSVFSAQWSREKAEQLESIISRLEKGEPVQYVVGTAEFFGLVFQVTPAVLIPRQETEELVAWVLEHLKTERSENHVRVIDIGLGSGCIGITLQKKFPAIQIFGLEKSVEALEIAQGNAKRMLGTQATFQFLQGDITIQSDWELFPEMDVIVSNPPYIPFSEKTVMPEHVLAHEPGLALFVSNEDPLLFYRTIADFALEKLTPGGVLFFECNEFNAPQVAALLLEKNFQQVTLRKDLSGSDRMVCGVRG